MIPSQERDEVAALSVWDAKPEKMPAKLITIIPKKISQFVLNLFVRIARPEGRLKKRKDGSEREIKLTKHNSPWTDGLLRPHPHAMISRKRSKKSSQKS